MQFLLYVETNFLISHAAGRAPATESLTSGVGSPGRLVIPGICFMEAFSTLEGERGRHNRLIADLESEISQVKRNVVSPNARALVNHLQQAVVESRAIFNDYAGRLYRLIEYMASSAEVIESTTQIVRDSLGNNLIDYPTDNLILTPIIAHARSRPAEIKVLLTENHKCFHQNPHARAAIQQVGLKYFADASKCLEWSRAQPDP